MSTAHETERAFTREEMADMQEALGRAMKGVKNPQKMREACERMDRTREEIRKRIGVIDFAVPTIRAWRDGE